MLGFDLAAIKDETVGSGSLDEAPMYEVLLALSKDQSTGRLTVENATGANHMFFMRGQPVGVQLAEFFHPLGQLLLELGRCDAATFLKAQRRIAAGNRLPGQVFKELGVLSDADLKEVLAVQARKKAEQFCSFGTGPFTFGRGLTFLAGFNSTPLDMQVVIYLAVQRQLGPAGRKAYLYELRKTWARIPEGRNLLPTALANYGFGPPEERFLTRLKSGWQNIRDATETGALPDEDVAVLLKYMSIVGWIETTLEPPAAQVDETAALPAPALDEDTPVFGNPLPSSDEIPASPSPIDRRPAPVFEEPRKKATPAPLPDEVFGSSGAGGSEAPKKRPEVTDPRIDIHNVKTAEANSIIVSPELMVDPKRKKKKKRKRRAEPEPSVGVTAETETRKEKTAVTPLPTIVIDED